MALTVGPGSPLSPGLPCAALNPGRPWPPGGPSKPSNPLERGERGERKGEGGRGSHTYRKQRKLKHNLITSPLALHTCAYWCSWFARCSFLSLDSPGSFGSITAQSSWDSTMAWRSLWSSWSREPLCSGKTWSTLVSRVTLCSFHSRLSYGPLVCMRMANECVSVYIYIYREQMSYTAMQCGRCIYKDVLKGSYSCSSISCRSCRSIFSM